MRFLGPNLIALGFFLGSGLIASAQTVITPKQLKTENLVTVYAADAGVMDKMGVAVGEQVSSGQVLAKLDDEKYIYNWRVARLKADNEGPLRSARGEVSERRSLLEDARERLRRRQVTQQYVDSLSARHESSMGRMEAAEMADQIAHMDLELAKSALQRRYIRSTVDGIVVEIAKPELSKVAQGDPIFTIADLNQLTAELPASAAMQQAYRNGKAIPIAFGPGGTVFSAMVVGLKDSPDKKSGGQIAQLIFPSLAPEQFQDSVSSVDPDEDASVAPQPPAPTQPAKSRN